MPATYAAVIAGGGEIDPYYMAFAPYVSPEGCYNLTGEAPDVYQSSADLAVLDWKASCSGCTSAQCQAAGYEFYRVLGDLNVWV